MSLSPAVRKILDNYESDTPGTKANLARILLLSKPGETAIDICAHAAHMAALLGAHIIKVKPPTSGCSIRSSASTRARAETGTASRA